jgi:hypothetical protein
MTNPTPEKLAALAELIGITPETHPQCWRWTDDERERIAHEPKYLPNPFDPDADPRAVDDVWLAPMKRYLFGRGFRIRVTARFYNRRQQTLHLCKISHFKSTAEFRSLLEPSEFRALYTAARHARVSGIVETDHMETEHAST